MCVFSGPSDSQSAFFKELRVLPWILKIVFVLVLASTVCWVRIVLGSELFVLLHSSFVGFTFEMGMGCILGPTCFKCVSFVACSDLVLLKIILVMLRDMLVLAFHDEMPSQFGDFVAASIG